MPLPSVVEVNTGLICGCMPVMKPFFRHVFSKTPPRGPQRYYASRTASGGSIWMGKVADDRARSNYRDFIELEHDGSFSDRVVVHGLKE